MRRGTLLVVCILVSDWAAAGNLLDYLRAYDLNDYAIGVAVTGEQNLYSGSENGAYAYPFLTSFLRLLCKPADRTRVEVPQVTR